MRTLFVFTLCILLLAGAAFGAEATATLTVNYADVLFVVAEEQQDGTWRFASEPGFEARRVSAAPQELTAYLVDSPPDMDGLIDPVWEAASPLIVALNCQGQPCGDVTLRAAYDSERLYLMARWPEAAPATTSGVVNKFTFHWQIAPEFIHCSVACHTAYVDAQKRVQVLNAETIPQAGHESLPAGGGWRNGEWIVEWSRPLLSDNPYDLQMSDLTVDYPFRLKIFEYRENQPDAMSDVVLLKFEPGHAGL